MDMTRNRNFGINRAWSLFPPNLKYASNKYKKEKVIKQKNKCVFHVNVPKTVGNEKIDNKNPLPWIE